MSHTWKATDWRARKRVASAKRTRLNGRQYSGYRKRQFTAEEVKGLVSEMRRKGIAVPALQDEQKRELEYVAVGGEA
jgi:hypothetical protein